LLLVIYSTGGAKGDSKVKMRQVRFKAGDKVRPAGEEEQVGDKMDDSDI
jgi:hypothetical protein